MFLTFRWHHARLFLFLFCTESVFVSDAVSEEQKMHALKREQVHFLGTDSKSGLDHWEPIEFEGDTEYRWQQLDGRSVLQASTRTSASGYLLEQKVDLQKFPYLNWQWRLEKPLPVLDETQKSGDDYAARIYVIVSGRWFFWQTKALNYVWSSRTVKGETWPNAYAPDNARMLAVRDQTDQLHTWYQEKRNVMKDLQNWLGEDVQHIDGLAIMSDSDDSQQHAIVYYGEIYFSAD